MYIKIKKDGTVVSLEILTPVITDTELYFEITDEQFFDFQRKIDWAKEYTFDAENLKQVKFTTELVKFLRENSKPFDVIDNYDFRLEGIDYKKITDQDTEYLAYLADLELKKEQANMQYNDNVLQSILVSTDFATNSPEVTDETKNNTIMYKSKVRQFKSDENVLKSTLEIDYKKDELDKFGNKIVIGYKFGSFYLETPPKIEFK